MCDEYNTEVELIPRDSADEPGTSFTGFVHRTQLIEGNQYITITYSIELGTCMADLNMENYFITAIMWQPHEGALLDRVGFGHDQEEQNEAYETLVDLLMMEERSEDREEEAMTIAGPKRMEVVLKQISSPTIVRRLIVTTILPPSGHFKNYMLGGRIYKTCGTLEKFKSTGMSSDMWRISEIKQYPGGVSAPATTYYGSHSVERMDAAWKKIVTFIKSLHPSEINVIQGWECKSNPLDDDDEDDLYGFGYGGMGGSHYTQRIPSAYQPPPPPVAMLRTAGDEVGKLIHLGTSEIEVARPDSEREMDILEYLEKKDEAETEENPEAEISASIEAGSKTSGDGGSSNNSDVSNIVFCDCGSPSCTTCQEIALAEGLLGAGGYLH